jgi:hypothetical protein
MIRDRDKLAKAFCKYLADRSCSIVLIDLSNTVGFPPCLTVGEDINFIGKASGLRKVTGTSAISTDGKVGRAKSW